MATQFTPIGELGSVTPPYILTSCTSRRTQLYLSVFSARGIQVIVTVLKICPSGPRALQSKKWLYKMLHRLVYNWIDLRNFLRYFAKTDLTL